MYTVVYPGVEPYLPAWYASVKAQTDRAFDLWISLDGLQPDDVAAALGETPTAQWLRAESGATPAALRSAGLARLVDEYRAVILVDSDDILASSRVASARAGLAGADVVGCALRIADAAGRPLGPVLAPPGTVPDWETLLPRHNVFGLSNTAYRSQTLRACLPVPADAVLIDWLLASRAWAMDARLRFDPEPGMVYRQHAGNLARVLPPYTPEYVMRATDLVARHYAMLLADGPPLGRLAAVPAVRSELQAFERAVRASPLRLQRYVEALNRLAPQYVWWWCVANSKLEDVWKN